MYAGISFQEDIGPGICEQRHRLPFRGFANGGYPSGLILDRIEAFAAHYLVLKIYPDRSGVNYLSYISFEFALRRVINTGRQN